jgi:hypothetical protein
MPDWKRKLAAYLHDPPEKAFDYGPHLLKSVHGHARNGGLETTWQRSTGQPGWAAASYRFKIKTSRTVQA